MEFSRQEYWSGLPFPSPFAVWATSKALYIYKQKWKRDYKKGEIKISEEISQRVEQKNRWKRKKKMTSSGEQKKQIGMGKREVFYVAT